MFNQPFFFVWMKKCIVGVNELDVGMWHVQSNRTNKSKPCKRAMIVCATRSIISMPGELFAHEHCSMQQIQMIRRVDCSFSSSNYIGKLVVHCMVYWQGLWCAGIGIRTVDVGMPQLSMHRCEYLLLSLEMLTICVVCNYVTIMCLQITE